MSGWLDVLYQPDWNGALGVIHHVPGLQPDADLENSLVVAGFDVLLVRVLGGLRQGQKSGREGPSSLWPFGWSGRLTEVGTR